MKKLEWSVNTPELLKDIIPNVRQTESISPSIITIFASLLAQVAKRATELHDAKLDSLMSEVESKCRAKAEEYK